MIHFGYLKLKMNNQKPYMNDEWYMLKDKHKMDKMLISNLDFELNDDFSLKKMKLNPLDNVATPLWPSVGVNPNTPKVGGLGILRDSRMFRARQQGPKHLALRCSWCHWKCLKA
jgi:hypothetical protein